LDTTARGIQPLHICHDHKGHEARIKALEKRAEEDRTEMRVFRREILEALRAIRGDLAALGQSVRDVEGVSGCEIDDDSSDRRQWLVDLFGPLVASAGKALVYASILIPIGLVVLSHPDVAAQAGDMIRAVGGIK